MAIAKFKDAFGQPAYANPWQAHGSIELVSVGVWHEFRSPAGAAAPEPHDHIAVLAAAPFRYLLVKRALLQHHGLACHWSCTHTGYWSCVRYCAMASQTKPSRCIDQHPGLCDVAGHHPAVEDCCYPPVTGNALNAKRIKTVQAAAEAGAADPKITDMDVWALGVRVGCHNTADEPNAHLQLIVHAKQHCGAAMVQYVWKRRHQLASIIGVVWQW